MEKEISSGTMLGIVLIALAAVIGLGFGVFSIAKGVANEGTVGVQDNLATVSESSFDDYNDKIVTGTMVKSAITNFSGKSVAILVNTTAMDKGVVTYSEHETTVHGYGFATNVSGKQVFGAVSLNNAADATGAKKGAFPSKVPTGFTGASIGTDFHYYINYNALLDSAMIGKNDSGTLSLKDGVYTASGIPFALDSSGKVAFDYSVGGLTRTGNCEYLNATAKFDANLIKDETGTTIGIVFTQRAQ